MRGHLGSVGAGPDRECLDRSLQRPAKLREVVSKDKPLDSYKILAMYGDNVVTTEGAGWRLHRKVTAASFNEPNAALTFAESIIQTAGMVSQWLGPDGKGNKTIKSLEHDAMNLTLHIHRHMRMNMGCNLPAATGHGICIIRLLCQGHGSF